MWGRLPTCSGLLTRFGALHRATTCRSVFRIRTTPDHYAYKLSAVRAHSVHVSTAPFALDRLV
jgi:hypothetical protein